MELCKHTPEWGVGAKSTILQLAKDNVIQILQQLKTIKVVLMETRGSWGSVFMVPKLNHCPYKARLRGSNGALNRTKVKV